eukprot:CAMPEP_0171058016 /NCGR_PEP_ID=MMETSP0766_2-20121228/2203_1 /TAXON_ID=439317 /ORGANISM="Gambierdiscus australes, Strain CAWD 149" /LENGTH=167 /DNA_ID=CAMNT_0011513229 /DNA_START=139 /DNA_END=640 /DNA_ORIENTATION=+
MANHRNDERVQEAHRHHAPRPRVRAQTGVVAFDPTVTCWNIDVGAVAVPEDFTLSRHETPHDSVVRIRVSKDDYVPLLELGIPMDQDPVLKVSVDKERLRVQRRVHPVALNAMQPNPSSFTNISGGTPNQATFAQFLHGPALMPHYHATLATIAFTAPLSQSFSQSS